MDSLREQFGGGGQGGQGGDFQGSRIGGDNSYGGNYPAGGGFSSGSDEDEFRRAHEKAAQHAGESGDSSLFSNILSSIGSSSKYENEDVDEDDAVKQHRKFYGDGEGGQADDKSVGAAAAMQALKMFNGGGASEGQSKGDFMGMAMSEASKLFDSKAANGEVDSNSSKESAVQKAGEMALKMYLKSQGGSGGSGGLMSLASKFL